MEQSTKTILWIVAFITLPITIPLAIISFGIVATVLLLVLSMILMHPIEIIVTMVVVVICYGVYRWLSRNG